VAKEREIEARLRPLTSPYRTAEAFAIEDIIDPRETRPVLCRLVELAETRLRHDLGPRKAFQFVP